MKTRRPTKWTDLSQVSIGGNKKAQNTIIMVTLDNWRQKISYPDLYKLADAFLVAFYKRAFFVAVKKKRKHLIFKLKKQIEFCLL